MKVLILYYSGTGNTKFACEVAGLAIERAGHDVTMTTYEKAGDVRLEDFDLYCFAAPVYEWAPARNVERFVRSIPALEGRRAFIVTSSAGATGQATPLFARMLEDRGLTVLGDHNLICPDSWGGTRRWSAPHDAETPTPESVRELAEFTDSMLEHACALEDGRAVSLPAYRVLPTGLFLLSRLTRAPGRWPRLKMGRKRVDESACTRCGVCVKNCPAGAIALDPYPAFGRGCIACWRCINTCPVDCITTIIDSDTHYKGITERERLLREAGL
ncbi:MAG: EFR1 family ferrodoxin [Actinobacteria bacterium]|nr:EFR1 family ferrodoxin [Actinomycetota bacterium]MBU1945069.1 EFR1 family ferrodoxin [Actinomycetota bacterium]MBU2688337.1 EFR1 family ferrodoxin [Actinomycetota bacterium]